jgi:SNF2 family DNA or RNA helicase
LSDGWKVEAEGTLYRSPGAMSMAVSSGIDWFELHGTVEFGEALQVNLPTLLGALKRGETMVQLGDGSFGLLPETWLKKYGLLASLGETEGDHLRFKQTQTGVLDALLAAQPEITCDEVFTRVREEWRNFSGVEPVAPPESFVGTLREYQCEGLGWFAFLQRFGFGGCLADDMGLGKTVQVLALLEQRRTTWENADKASAGQSPQIERRLKSFRQTAKVQTAPRTSLVVVPRSLIFNWQQEAARFTPQLRLLTHMGGDRTKDAAHFSDYDLVLTTYGTLLRDAVHFNEAEFDFVILDEAQAIKNAKTESAKAARLLKAKHRLALSGTPIENHLGELWSLFEFLNPGMLGGPAVFQLSANGNRAPDPETRNLLARALRPFILRRTKQQVAKELPEKLEQTIFCEMEPAQQKHYDELRDYYRGSLLDRVKSVGINRAKMHILEALLRLRQAACHPALITKSAGTEPSAKLDVLLPQLFEVTEEGHKALVFSQFTSFLAIVRARLDQQKVAYEYLDGKTRDRAARVERFQNDPACKLFLISLKAGGLGLNLTAAEYVFLLDPWWNPAVEAQAIDRAHRIGQSQRVFAYRLITRGTVEEKVLALQETKKELADSILSADNNLIRNITKDDLLLLLS